MKQWRGFRIQLSSVQVMVLLHLLGGWEDRQGALRQVNCSLSDSDFWAAKINRVMQDSQCR